MDINVKRLDSDHFFSDLLLWKDRKEKRLVISALIVLTVIFGLLTG